MTLINRVIRKAWYILAAVIILAALLVSITRLLTPVLNDHRADFEKLASDLLKMPVMIREVQVDWHGYSPEILLHNVTVLDPDTQKPKVNMELLEIDFSIWRTLLTRKIYIRNLTLSGMELTVTQKAAGQIQIGELTSLNIKDTLTGSSVRTDEVFDWVFSQPRLALENIDILYYAPDQDVRSVTLKSLALGNKGDHHIIDGKAVLNQELPVKMDVHLSWDGDARHLEKAKGHFYLYFEGLVLRQWFSKFKWNGMQIKKGLASIKFWGNWDDNQWLTLQTTFQAYDLAVFSEKQNRTEKIDRLRGNVGWKRDGDAQIISGEEIFIDFPNHLWPAVNFEIKLTGDITNNPVINAFQFNYLNLADAMKIVSLADTIVSDSIRQQLIGLAPDGVLQNVKMTVPNPLTAVKDLVFSGDFTGISLKPLKQFPGVSNLKGSLNWNKNQGNIKLNSLRVSLDMPQLFNAPLYFSQLAADIAIARTDDGIWSAAAKNINLSNVDIVTNTSFVINHIQDENPDIDFTSQFKVNDAARLASYLPEKAFDRDLSKWLANAFKKGMATAGLAEFKGKLKDYPFDNNNGKFLITMQLKSMDLNFAPGWPYITDLNGDIHFSGRSMTVNILSGSIAEVPVKKIVAVIPYIGDAAPQFLKVDGVIESDMQQGLNFIHQSPLQKTVGMDLAGMNLLGGMQINKSINIPLRHPEKTTVLGDVLLTDVELSLPQWKIIFNKLNGRFQFTETGIQAKDIQGQLFGSPATLNMKTLYDEKKQEGQVQADIESVISIPILQNWTGMQMSAVANGSTNYHAQLLLPPHSKGVALSTTGQISITTDLKGMSINLPEPYAKKADAKGFFQMDLATSGDANSIKAKINYNKQISAALNLKAAGFKMQLNNGEIRFGGGAAEFQVSPGILISGQMNQLDWDTWPDYFASLKNNTLSINAKTAKANTAAELKLLRAINLNIATVNIMSQQLHSVYLEASNNPDKWTVNLQSNELGGQITIPDNLTSQPIQAHFQHVNLQSADAKKMKQKIDPKTLPGMLIESDSTQLGDMHIGHLNIILQPSGSGLNIKQLQINEPALTLNASGEWQRNFTHLTGEIKSPKVSDVLIEWGFNASNFIGSTADIKFNLDWPDAPYQLTLNGLSGNVSFNFGEGRITELSDASNAKIGLGRMLNLFSLSTLPRRLSLNFSDVTQKGFSFDYMKGDFTIKNGNALTDNMRFDGPIARVEIKGRVGLAAKDFNIQLGITPYVTGSLPVVAAFAGGPIVGVAALLVDKVVSQGVSKVITHEYSVTGPWTNPVWAPVVKTPAPR